MNSDWFIYASGAVLVYFLFRWGRVQAEGPAPDEDASGYFARLRAAAEIVQGRLILQSSTVGGHLCWTAHGRLLYFYERTHGPTRWSVISVGVNQGAFPTYQVRPHDGPIPALPPLRPRPQSGCADEFDGRFEIRIGLDSPDTLGPSRDVRSHLLDLVDLCFPAHPVLEVHDDRARLYVPMILEAQEGRRSFLTKGERILGALLEEFTEAGTSVHLLDVLVMDGTVHEVCKVCGEAVGEDRVLCASCSAPHHRDCWAYTGMCAIFGCQSRKCRNA